MRYSSSSHEGLGSPESSPQAVPASKGASSATHRLVGGFAGILLLAGTIVTVPLLTGSANATAASEVCPSIGDDAGTISGALQGCGVVITIASNGIVSAVTTAQGPYDGNDDTLVGVINNSSSVVPSMALSAAVSGQNIFSFDGDGICTYYSAANSSNDYWKANAKDTDLSVSGLSGAYCATGHAAAGNVGENKDPAGLDYQGPMNTWSGIAANNESGTVDFTNGLQPGATTFFSLEDSPTSSGGSGGGSGGGGSTTTTSPSSPSAPYQVSLGTTTSLGTNPSTVALGGTFTLIATVSGVAANPATGTVSWTVTDPNAHVVPCATKTLVSNAGSCTISGAVAGQYTATAAYSGDANNAPSTSTPLNVVVSTSPASTTTANTPPVPVVAASHTSTVCVNKTHVVRVRVIELKHGQRIALIKRETRTVYRIVTIKRIERRHGKRVVVLVHKKVAVQICHTVTI